MKPGMYWMWAAGLLLGAVLSEASDAWPEFRGPTSDGHAKAQRLPLSWNEQSNVVWKTAIHDRGWSSPVVWGKQIWLTTATEDGRALYAVSIDRDTGAMRVDRKLFDIDDPQFAHKFNSYASPTPVIEEGRVYVTFGSPGTACLDTATGEVLWERRDFICNHYRGAGSSPILYGSLLLMHFDGSDRQYVVALDKRTGRTVWRTERSVDFQDLDPDGKPQIEGDFRKAYSTPVIARFGDEPLFLSLGSRALYAYEPLTGKERWRAENRRCFSGTARPVLGHGLIYVCWGFSRGELNALQPGVSGVLPESAVVWKTNRSVPMKPSLLLVDELILMVDDSGIASALEARTGQLLWNERIGGNYSASPVYAAGRVYCFSEEGKTTVLEPSRQFKVLATSQLDEGFMASPAIADEAFYLRTKTHLYRIESR